MSYININTSFLLLKENTFIYFYVIQNNSEILKSPLYNPEDIFRIRVTEFWPLKYF